MEKSKTIVCFPTLKRYDLLIKAIESCEKGEVRPDSYWIVDNGGQFDKETLPEQVKTFTYIYDPGMNIGVAKAWNLFLQLDAEYKIICNDDIEFYTGTLKLLIESYNEYFISYPAGIPSANSFSCFLIPNKIIKEVGYFDESISPNYAYFEDNDYHRRMLLKGFDIKGVEDCKLGHFESATLKSMTLQERELHHRRFRLAEHNYIVKWGGIVGKETYKYPYNKEE